ncbi:ankyrin repeat domain-containing protein [Shewanella algae]|uniref:ankyrin repeat domain-containing protein n=1 Tax=Shewanella algae TaxID=38313 RepID=UPI00300436C3
MKRCVTWFGVVLTCVLSACGVGGKQMDAEQFFKPEMVTVLQHIQQGHEKEARAALTDGQDLNIHGDEDITPLLWLILQQDKAAVALALKLGADANFKRANGDNAITAVAGNEDTDWLKMLLEAGGDPNSVDRNKEPALFQAVGEGNKEAVEILLDHDADVNAVDGPGSNALQYAAAINDFEMVYFLLQHGADFTHRNDTGADLAWNIHKKLSRGLVSSSSDNYEWLMKSKQFIEEKGVSFPPLSPKEVRAIWAKEGKPGY